MRIEFFYQPQDFLELRKLLARAEPSSKRIAQGLTWVIAIALAVGFFILQNKMNALKAVPAPVTSRPSTSGLITFWVSLAIAILLLTGLLYFTYVWPRKQFGNRMMQTDPELQLSQTLEITDEGISRITRNSQATWTWDAFSQFLENEHVLALKRGAIEYVVIPKRSLTPEQLEPLTTLLRSRIQPQAGAPPVSPLPPAKH